jgi:hypothetical protein
MFQTVSGAGLSLQEKREKAAEKKGEKRLRLGPFHHFLIVCSAMIVVMWGVILFGGKKPMGDPFDVDKHPRVFLFMVDSAIKRYHHYEKKGYPDKLPDLTPKYLPLRKDDQVHLNRLTYRKDEQKGYLLAFARSKPGEMKLTISAKGIAHELIPRETERNE